MNKISIVILMILSFAGGRYLTPPIVTIQTKIVTIEKEVETKRNKTTVTIEKPDGTKETTTVDNSTTSAKTDSKTESKTVDKHIKNNTLNVSGLIGYATSPLTPVYGVTVNKSILGPITAGFWATTGFSGGLSLGLNF